MMNSDSVKNDAHRQQSMLGVVEILDLFLRVLRDYARPPGGHDEHKELNVLYNKEDHQTGGKSLAAHFGDGRNIVRISLESAGGEGRQIHFVFAPAGVV
jgi:hypothetical protein|eukprot:COSAG01_NODE_3635_length_5844_cov_19.933507_3_plen_99_part_00